MPNYWLFKTEPETFGWERLKREGRTEWSGVRNYQARNNMLAMKLDDPRWSMVEVKFKKKLKRNISLTELKTKRELKDLILLRPGSRLSVSPVSQKDWDFIATDRELIDCTSQSP